MFRPFFVYDVVMVLMTWTTINAVFRLHLRKAIFTDPYLKALLIV
jgi:hypothetical protein